MARVVALPRQARRTTRKRWLLVVLFAPPLLAAQFCVLVLAFFARLWHAVMAPADLGPHRTCQSWPELDGVWAECSCGWEV